jgi:phage tail protein X
VRYSLNPGGSIYGSEQTVDNMFMGRLGAVTPIENVFMTGAWVFAGGMSAALMSGRDTARMVEAHLAGEKIESLYSADPGLSAEEADLPEGVEIRTPAGQLPAVTLTACGSGREVALRGTGKPEVLIFHAQATADAAGAVNEAVRQRYPMASSVVSASVVDLCSVPRLFRKVAERSMRKAYNDAASSLADGLSAEDYVVILPDWDGSITKAVGLDAVDKTAGVAVIDRSGKIVGVHQGKDLAAAALNMLARAGA